MSKSIVNIYNNLNTILAKHYWLMYGFIILYLLVYSIHPYNIFWYFMSFIIYMFMRDSALSGKSNDYIQQTHMGIAAFGFGLYVLLNPIGIQHLEHFGDTLKSIRIHIHWN